MVRPLYLGASNLLHQRVFEAIDGGNPNSIPLSLSAYKIQTFQNVCTRWTHPRVQDVSCPLEWDQDMLHTSITLA